METTRLITSPGELLKEFLRGAQMTQKELAARTGYSANFINMLTKNQRWFNANVAGRIAKVFETTPDFWLNAQFNYLKSKAKYESNSRV